VGWQFGDGHLHNEFFINAVQERCGFDPGELIVVLLESQPWHTLTQRYRVVDAALGVIETGVVDVHDEIATQPWLPDGPIPYRVERRATEAERSGPSAPSGPSTPSGPSDTRAPGSRRTKLGKQ
jgi:hypothetical protein